MTLNYSHRTFFPVNPSEENLVSSVRDRYVIEGKKPEKMGGFDLEFVNKFDWGKDGADKGGSLESVTNDIIDLLPSDPFGMGISATFLAGCFVDDFDTDRLSIMWNGTLTFQTEPSDMEIYERSKPLCESDSKVGVSRSSGQRQDGCEIIRNADKFPSFNTEDMHLSSQLIKESGKGTGICRAIDEGVPNDALLFALGYLGVQDLLSAEKVCRSFRSAIQSDALLWKNIYINQPLSARITDDALLSLTNRAQGNLLCLSLVGCSRITDNGLKNVLECNPKLTKLNVAGCIGLSIDGLVNNLRAVKSSGTSGLNHLRIGGRYGITSKHFEELKSLIGADKCMQPKVYKPRFYRYGPPSLSCDDDRALDIEICPRCENLRLVYDCSAEGCQKKEPGSEICRACIFCIPRCVQCGRCVNDSEYEETFCLDTFCLKCFKQLLSCQEEQEEKGAYSEHTNFHHETTTYCIQLWG
ncbi:F-box protein skip14 [Thalictrum thalictroides]|uniref:F-box protein skip14 n=1 Tax=Thalictrum thalictroides TaxID=46969 RepID=A0A7J6UXP3_THATH|nr:F-box protein skip14 [Thalictrum thalictroides]